MPAKTKDDKSKTYFIITVALLLVVSTAIYLSLLYRIQDTEKRAFESIHELRVENEKLRLEHSKTE